MEDLVSCRIIGVDCALNDPVDVKAGGPEYLGFDFYVREEQTEEMKNFVIEILNKYEVPCIGINTYGWKNLEEEKVWTKERIEQSISRDAEYLQFEASRNYTSRSW